MGVLCHFLYYLCNQRFVQGQAHITGRHALFALSCANLRAKSESYIESPPFYNIVSIKREILLE